MDSTMPVIDMPSAWCPAHWREFEARLPRRSVVVMTLKLWDQLMADEAFAKAAGSYREPPEFWELPTDFTEFNYAMRRKPFVPWCCYLGPERREAAWEETPFLDPKT